MMLTSSKRPYTLTSIYNVSLLVCKMQIVYNNFYIFTASIQYIDFTKQYSADGKLIDKQY